jgi:short-subunit dehydrogenase
VPKGETVLVTGAGSGIGREFARRFMADQSTVIAASLVAAELEELQAEFKQSSERLITIQIDLSKPDAAAVLVDECGKRGLLIDVLINNAGFACFGDAVDDDLGKISAMIALNVVTLTKLSVLIGRQMKANGRGNILNVGSTAGMMPSARMAAYCATKSYVNTFSYALAAELAPFGVRVTCLTPGATATKFAQSGGIANFKGQSMLKTMFETGKAGSPVEVARAGYAGLRAGKRHVLAGKGAKIAAVISRLVHQSSIPGLFKNV